MPNREPDVGEERAAEYISHILVSINGYVLMSLSIITYTIELLWSQKNQIVHLMLERGQENLMLERGQEKSPNKVFSQQLTSTCHGWEGLFSTMTRYDIYFHEI